MTGPAEVKVLHDGEWYRCAEIRIHVLVHDEMPDESTLHDVYDHVEKTLLDVDMEAYLLLAVDGLGDTYAKVEL